MTSCRVIACDRRSTSRWGWCDAHTQRWSRHGDPERVTKPDGPSRFLSLFTMNADDLGESCWLWNGPMTGTGYGMFQVDGKKQMAHRYSYEWFVGPIPEGLFLDHLCHGWDEDCTEGVNCPHRRCINPAHLEPVTQAENNRRGRGISGVNGRKTHCQHGHEFTPENTIRKGGGRECRKCTQEISALAWKKAKEGTSNRQRCRIEGCGRYMDSNGLCGMHAKRVRTTGSPFVTLRRGPKRKTHCKRGHEYTDGTTYWQKDGSKGCKICRKAAADRSNARAKAKRAAARLTREVDAS